MDHRSPRPRLRSRSPGPGGIGSSTATWRSKNQVAEVDKVKRSEAGMIVEPVTLPPDARVADALSSSLATRISGVPITRDDGILVGILTQP
jgi:IMP dehydrogenase